MNFANKDLQIMIVSRFLLFYLNTEMKKKIYNCFVYILFVFFIKQK